MENDWVLLHLPVSHHWLSLPSVPKETKDKKKRRRDVVVISQCSSSVARRYDDPKIRTFYGGGVKVARVHQFPAQLKEFRLFVYSDGSSSVFFFFKFHGADDDLSETSTDDVG